MNTRLVISIFVFAIFQCCTGLLADEIHVAALTGDLDKVKEILAANPEAINQIDDYKYTPLDWAATRAQWDVLRYLLDSGAKADNIGWDGGTVLHRAAHYDAPEIIELLISKGADPDVRNQWGRNALHVAARRNCQGIARLLISRGMDLSIGTKEGWTPLHVAAKSGHPDMIQLLLDSGAPADAKDQDGKTYHDVLFVRPAVVEIPVDKLQEYIGLYTTEEGFRARIWMKDDTLYVTDFGYDSMYACGEDKFFCEHEPWSVTFFRNADGKVTEMELAFLRRSHRMKKAE